MRTVEDLVTTLRTAADTVPEPFDILAGVEARRRHRTRRRYQAAFAAAAVVGIVVAGTVALRGGGGGQRIAAEPQPTSSEAPARSMELTAPKADTQASADKVWPEAVFLMPKKAADGFAYRPFTALSPTEVLLSAESSFEKAGRIEVYDLKSGASRVVTEMPPHEKGYFEQSAVAGDAYIAWWGDMPNTSRKWADFWVAPREGGKPFKVGEVKGDLADVDRIGVTREYLIWSPSAGGVYRMPINGGAPEEIPGTDGLWLREWPWAADVRDSWFGRGMPGRNQSVLVNLENGERETFDRIRPAGVTDWRCSLTWCYGADGDDNVISRADGSDVRKVAGLGLSGEIHGDRFVEGGAGVYDLATGKTGAVMARSPDGQGGSRAVGTSSSPTLIFYWNALPIGVTSVCRDTTTADVAPGEPSPTPGSRVCSTRTTSPGKNFKVLNLAAIPPAE